MAVILHPRSPFVFGIPANPERPLITPDGCTKAKLRFRNREFAVVVMKIGNDFIQRAVIDCGDHFEPGGFDHEQGRNSHRFPAGEHLPSKPWPRE